MVAYPIKISSALAALFLWPILSLLYLTNTGAFLMILSCWRGDESNMLSIISNIANIFLCRVLIRLHRVYRCCWLQRLCLIKSSNFTLVDVIVLILGIGIALKVNLLLIILLHRLFGLLKYIFEVSRLSCILHAIGLRHVRQEALNHDFLISHILVIGVAKDTWSVVVSIENHLLGDPSELLCCSHRLLVRVKGSLHRISCTEILSAYGRLRV